MSQETQALPNCRLTVCGIAELDACGDGGSIHMLSLLDPRTPDPEAWRRLGAVRHHTLYFHDIIAPFSGYSAPQAEHVEGILAFGNVLAEESGTLEHVLVHCHMGISRSTAAMVILLAQHEPKREDEAFERLFAIRPRAWPNSRMVAIADRLLQRRGALEAALRRHQRRIIEHHPDIANLVIDVGRGHELPR